MLVELIVLSSSVENVEDIVDFSGCTIAYEQKIVCNYIELDKEVREGRGDSMMSSTKIMHR